MQKLNTLILGIWEILFLLLLNFDFENVLKKSRVIKVRYYCDILKR